MLGNIKWPELIVILVIVLLIFGAGRISKIAGEIGSGIRSFKEGLSGKKETEEKDTDQNDSSKE